VTPSRSRPGNVLFGFGTVLFGFGNVLADKIPVVTISPDAI
jgi:hypothetical protein